MATTKAKPKSAARIVARSIEFGAKPFRKFKNMRIPLAPRITLICGHNGVGKSTILGMLASTSGLTKAKGTPNSYFGKKYEANVNEIIFVDYASEVAAAKAAGHLSEPVIEFAVGNQILRKECSLTRRGSALRARVVSRTTPHARWEGDGLSVGPDAKLPLPTLFLGMARMLPIGESPDSRIQNNLMMAWDTRDADFLINFVRSVIPGAGATVGELAANRVKQTTKISTHPKYPYGPRAVSLGQDSLGSIGTALASFHRIKKIQGDSYRGGLLIIDELDAGFHPHAIGVLVDQIRKAADELSLQIVATTHSTKLIEAVHPEGSSKKARDKDAVIYLRDTKSPKFDPSFGLADILNDMDLVPPPALIKPPVLQVYFEDDEAGEVFGMVTRPDFLRELEAKHGVSIKPMPLGVGCSSLASLPSKDSYFYSVVLAVDADGSRPSNVPPNLVELPGGMDASGKALSPERTIINFVNQILEDPDSHTLVWADPRLSKYSTDNVRANLLDPYDWSMPASREFCKKWWKERSAYIKRWGLYDLWAKANADKIAKYETALDGAVQSAAKEKRSQAWLAKGGRTR